MRFDLLVLAPHADDAAFSVGGRIAAARRAGDKVGLLTVFRSDRWQTDGGTFGDERTRSAEDVAYAAALGLELLPPILDEAPLRDARYRSGRRLFEWIDPTASDTKPLIDKLVDQIGPLQASTVLAPLGVGEHVDHQLVHWAARSLARQVIGNVEYYEDCPYALMPGHIEARLTNLGIDDKAATLGPAMRAWSQTPLLQRMSPIARPFVAWTFCRSLRRRRRSTTPRARFASRDQEIDLDERVAAIGRYASQWPLFYPTLDEWRGNLPMHERYWRERR